MLGNKEWLACAECPHCKPKGIKKMGYGEGYRYGICGQGGNIVFLEHWKEKRIHGSGCIHRRASSCCLYEKDHREDMK